jgi:DNA polymerase/3'-5' exonuclease PolX
MSPEKYTNRQVAEIFKNIADLLEIKGEVIYKILAYRKAKAASTSCFPADTLPTT